MKKLFLSLFCAALILGGCSFKGGDDTQNQAKVDELLTLVDQQQKTIDELNAQLQDPNINEMFPVYSLDAQAQNEEINFYVHLPADLTMEEKIKELAEKLSSLKFDGLPVEVMKIEEKDGKQIATINLKELTSEGLPSWMRGYFQGSAGGQATTLTLTKSFLQPDYQGEWIEGVEFYHEGKPVTEMDHVNLAGIKMREAQE